MISEREREAARYAMERLRHEWWRGFAVGTLVGLLLGGALAGVAAALL
jgi:ElaB/YqjD/DUF883 family membrane-anchored ribosome-binding protein